MTNKLAKHYSALTRDERFSLLIGAASRQDEAEVQRLLAAGKRLTYSVPDTLGPATAFLLTGLNHRASVLEEATSLFATVALDVQRPSKHSRPGRHVFEPPTVHAAPFCLTSPIEVATHAVVYPPSAPIATHSLPIGQSCRTMSHGPLTAEQFPCASAPPSLLPVSPLGESFVAES